MIKDVETHFPVMQWDPDDQPILEHDPNLVFINDSSWNQKSNHSFYVVYAGRQLGVYKTWFACAQRVHQHCRSRYAGAKNLKWAQVVLALSAPLRMLALCPPPGSVVEHLDALAGELKDLYLDPQA